MQPRNSKYIEDKYFDKNQMTLNFDLKLSCEKTKDILKKNYDSKTGKKGRAQSLREKIRKTSS